MPNIDTIIYNAAKQKGLPDAVAKNLVAQARYESNDYKSNVFKQNNNLFGYKYVGQPNATPGTPAPRSEWTNPNVTQYYAKYANVADSANEVIKWLYRRENEGKFKVSDLVTAEKYAAALKAGNYYGQSAYEYGIGLLAKYKNIIINTTTSISLILVLLATYFFIKK
jgi:flagellum-specific peptidoglycan hydrolase FlgJ